MHRSALRRPVAPDIIRQTQHQRIVAISANTSYDVPRAALHAYRSAADSVAASDPGCHLSWGVLAGIGQVESDHGRYGGAVVLKNGLVVPTILGPILDGQNGNAAIRDTDHGTLDGDTVWDRAVGPMQFIPSTWAAVGVDADGDGVANPNDINDAALSAAHYLCNGGRNMATVSGARAAVFSYNHSAAYVALVLALAHKYDSGVVTVVPDGNMAQVAARRHHGSQQGHVRHRTHAATIAKPLKMPLLMPQPTPTQAPRPKRSPLQTPVYLPAPGPTHFQGHPKKKRRTRRHMSGKLGTSASSWTIDGNLINVGTTALATIQKDYDGDGVAEVVLTELTDMIGKKVSVGIARSGLVDKINGLAYNANAKLLKSTATQPGNTTGLLLTTTAVHLSPGGSRSPQVTPLHTRRVQITPKRTTPVRTTPTHTTPVRTTPTHTTPARTTPTHTTPARTTPAHTTPAHTTLVRTLRVKASRKTKETGTLGHRASSWTISGNVINVGTTALATIQKDYDKDGVLQIVSLELTGLLGKTISVDVAQSGLVDRINGLAYNAKAIPPLTQTDAPTSTSRPNLVQATTPDQSTQVDQVKPDHKKTAHKTKKGKLGYSASSWTIDGSVINVGTTALATTQKDYNKNGRRQLVSVELTSLIGKVVKVDILHGLVDRINGLAYNAKASPLLKDTPGSNG